MTRMLNEHGYNFLGDYDTPRLVPDIKETLGYVALDFEAEVQKAATTVDCNTSYTLPDGNEIVISHERFRCPELLFKPNLNGFEFDGIHKALFGAIMKCELGIHEGLFANIVLSGGTSMFAGLQERLEKEIRELHGGGGPITIKADPRPEFAVWVGGSILASIEAFPRITITRQEYNEQGPAIVRSRCFETSYFPELASNYVINWIIFLIVGLTDERSATFALT